MKKSRRVLKEKILQQVGITGSEKEEKVRIAEEILDSSEHKQDLCNNYPGLDFDFVEKIMKEVLRNNKLRESDMEKPEVVVPRPEAAPQEKIEEDRPRKKTPMSYYTREEVAALLKGSK